MAPYALATKKVLAAFREASSALSIKGILEVLNGLDYRYPYHQAIGFYLSRSGFTDSDTETLLSRGIAFDFYLANKLVNPSYDKKWRLYYPRGVKYSSTGLELLSAN